MTARDRAEWADLMRDQTAAALASGIIATMDGTPTAEEAMAVWLVMRDRFYPGTPHDERAP